MKSEVVVLVKEADNGYDRYTEVVGVFFEEETAIKFKDNLPKTDDIWANYRVVKSTFISGGKHE